jgi:hypothetical protein
LCFSAAAPASTVTGFQPWAASFVSPSTGFVLGGVGCSFGEGVQHPCRAVLMATRTAGASWTRLAAPDTTLAPMPGRGVRGVVFADPRDGWLFGPGLWSTHDGGAHWTRVVPKQQVVDVVAAGGWAYAVASAKSAGIGVRATPLLRSPVGQDNWRPVASLLGTVAPDIPGLLVASGANVWAGLIPESSIGTSSEPIELWRSVGGGAWQRLGESCSGRASLMAAASSSDLVLLCGGSHPQIGTSTDGGAHLKLVAASSGTLVSALAAPLGQTRRLVAAFPPLGLFAGAPEFTASSILVTTNDGATWSRSLYHDHGAGFAGLEFVSATDGWIVHGYPGAAVDQLLHTSNAGATFTPVRF